MCHETELNLARWNWPSKGNNNNNNKSEAPIN